MSELRFMHDSDRPDERRKGLLFGHRALISRFGLVVIFVFSAHFVPLDFVDVLSFLGFVGEDFDVETLAGSASAVLKSPITTSN